tara:strand:- start:225 stop:524 length:300 start_codon:yes stop_codon:yes gene_type:complete
MTEKLKLTSYNWIEGEDYDEIKQDEMEAISETHIFTFSLYASRNYTQNLGDYFNAPEVDYDDIFAEITNFEAFDINYEKVNITEEQKNQVIKEIIYEIN